MSKCIQCSVIRRCKLEKRTELDSTRIFRALKYVKVLQNWTVITTKTEFICFLTPFKINFLIWTFFYINYFEGVTKSHPSKKLKHLCMQTWIFDYFDNSSGQPFRFRSISISFLQILFKYYELSYIFSEKRSYTAANFLK